MGDGWSMPASPAHLMAHRMAKDFATRGDQKQKPRTLGASARGVLGARLPMSKAEHADFKNARHYLTNGRSVSTRAISTRAISTRAMASSDDADSRGTSHRLGSCYRAVHGGNPHSGLQR